MGFPENLTAEEYYDLLLEKAPPPQQPQPGKGQQGGSGEGGSGEGGGGEGGGEGAGGGPGSGEGSQEGSGSGSGGGPASMSEEARRFYEGGGCGSCTHGDDDTDPSSAEGLPDRPREQPSEADAKARRLRKEVADTAEEHARSSGKGIGSLPSTVRRLIEEQRRPPKLNWRALLYSEVERALNRVPGDESVARTRLARYSAWQKPLQKLQREEATLSLAVIVDTSGSMGSAELSTALDEVGGILRRSPRLTNDSIQFLSVDTMVHTHETVRDAKQAAQALAGGGGTDMMEGVRWLAEDKSSEPDVVIVLTDGMTHIPDRNPYRRKGIHSVIFVVIGPRAQAQAISRGIPRWAKAVPVPTDEM